jgi:COP9 signalosome complex subunit 6
MNIADHEARQVSEMGTTSFTELPRVMGAVFGIQQKQTVEVYSSVELEFSYDEEKQLRIDDEAFAEDYDLYKQIYPEHECLGWYSTAQQIQPTDLPFHKRFTEYNESPLYIMMNPTVMSDAKALPVKCYRTEMRQIQDSNRLVFVELAFKIISSPAERVATDHVLQNKDIVTTGSQIVPEFAILKNAVGALRARIALLIEYLVAVETGKVEADSDILRNIESVCNRLPVMTNEKFNEDFFSEMSNGMMMTYLASMTKAAAKVNSMLDIYDQMREMGGGGGRRGRGGYGREMGMGMGMMGRFGHFM